MHLSKLVFFLWLNANFALSQNTLLKDHILFYCSFDDNINAAISVGDPLLYTAKNYDETDNAKSGLHNPDVVLAKNKGLTGDALHFKKKNTSAIYFSGHKNLGYSPNSWSGSFSFWLQVDPDQDLPPGYCDPINLTDTKYNDAALWVDFTDGNPRKFRLGVLGDLAVWNPENTDNQAAFERRLVTVNQPPFASGKWTHIMITFSQINTDKSLSKLYLNGQLQGTVKDINDPFSWNEENAKIMLGLGYVGLMDELTVFNKALDQDEVNSIYQLKSGVKALFK